MSGTFGRQPPDQGRPHMVRLLKERFGEGRRCAESANPCDRLLGLDHFELEVQK